MSIRDEMNAKLDSSMLTSYDEIKKVFLERCEKISKDIFKKLHDKLLKEANNAQGNLIKSTIEISEYFSLGNNFLPYTYWSWMTVPFLFSKNDITDTKIIEDFCSLPVKKYYDEIVYEEKEVEKGFFVKHKEFVRTSHIEEKAYVEMPLSFILFFNKLKEDAVKFDEKSEFIISTRLGKFVDNNTYKILLDSKYGYDKGLLDLCVTVKYHI